jgi:GNAT superfamily N-acetyltransferase
MDIKELSPEALDDWLDFFGTRAFADHGEWKGCYCTAFYYPKPPEYADAGKRRIDYARWLIAAGRMRGYLAYEDGRAIAWVNANAKRAFPRLGGEAAADDKILSIVCFIVEKPYRGQGVATLLLKRIIADAADKGYAVIEAYPKRGAKSEYGRWNGPYEMYKKAGFTDFGDGAGKCVRKYLGAAVPDTPART